MSSTGPGGGISIEFGAPCLDCTIQSVVQGDKGPLALTMSPMEASAHTKYTYSLVPWNLKAVSAGIPSSASEKA